MQVTVTPIDLFANLFIADNPVKLSKREKRERRKKQKRLKTSKSQGIHQFLSHKFSNLVHRIVLFFKVNFCKPENQQLKTLTDLLQ